MFYHTCISITINCVQFFLYNSLNFITFFSAKNIFSVFPNSLGVLAKTKFAKNLQWPSEATSPHLRTVGENVVTGHTRDF
jgi:hypothetical protein